MPEEMASKFWSKADGSGSSSGDEQNSSSSSSSDSELEGDVKVTVKKGVAASGAASRWAAMSGSSDNDEKRRVVRSAKDKQWSNLQQIIRTMANHKKIEDFAQVQEGFDALLKAVQKAKSVIDKEGLPSFFIRVIADIETYVNDRFSDKESLKKLTKPKLAAFNTLRAKVRKGIEEYRDKIEEYRKDPEAFVEDDDEDSAFGSDDFDESSSEASSSESESDSGKDSHKTSTAGDSDDDNWSSSTDEEEEEATGEVDLHQLAMSRWGKKTDDKKKKTKEKSKAREKTKAPKQVAEAVVQTGRSKEASLIQPGEKIDVDLLVKKLQEVTALRGRKGFDRIEQIRHLHELAEAAETLGPKNVLEVRGHLISAYFDANLGAFAYMPTAQWLQCYRQLDSALSILKKEKDCYFPFLLAEEDEEDIGAFESQNETISTTALLKAQQEEGLTKEAKSRLNTALMLTIFLERLDEELTKALQLIDVHADEYKVRLGQTVDVLALLWKAYVLFTSAGHYECARKVCLRTLEHVYYKNDAIASRMWELVKKRLDTNEAALLLHNDEKGHKVVSRLCRHILEAPAADIKTKTRVILYSAYHESLHGRFYNARDLLQTANVQELASQCSISIQILYNRNLVQLGLAAFRQGLIMEAHSYLSEVCAMGRYKELLAQNISTLRGGVEKSLEQERLEKRRLLPYHMHIAADLVEAIHNICAMLLEVPYMAANPLDYAKKPIARNFRRLLEGYDRQIFTGPPENPRETVLAATKALQKGNWKTCSSLIMAMKFWDSLPDTEKVKDILMSRIKQEALRTYLFSYCSLYDSINTKQLSEMFSLPVSTAHSIVSKMMIQGTLSGSWDEASECVLMNRIDRTPLQVLALQLTEKIAGAVDQNEVMLNYRNPKYVMAQANQQGARRYDDRWGGDQQQQQPKRFYGRGDDTGDKSFNQYRTPQQHPRFSDRPMPGGRRRW